MSTIEKDEEQQILQSRFDRLKELRAPFPPNQISLLPRPTKKENPKGRCSECGGWHGLPAVHLSYVGHAALTDRLLDVDPMWTWEPLAISPEGIPVLDSVGGMWIRLTICGVTRLGYGNAGDKEGGDAIKEIIGDALRNAAMRFGAALDLWHKGDLHAHEEEGNVTEKPSPTDVGQSGAALKYASFNALQPEVQDSLRAMVPRLVVQAGHKSAAGVITIVNEAYDNWPDHDKYQIKMALWHLLDSKTRTAISALEKR